MFIIVTITTEVIWRRLLFYIILLLYFTACPKVLKCANLLQGKSMGTKWSEMTFKFVVALYLWEF